MRTHLRLAATALALVFAFAGTTAQGFVLEPKGPAAKWRSDIVKKQNKYTACALGAWVKCEKAATKLGGNGFVDCDVTQNPVAPGANSILPAPATAAIRAVADTALAKCDLIVQGGKGLGAANAKAVGLGFGQTLADIGCQGDCGAADGSQACTGPTATAVSNWENFYIDPVANNGNVRNTAVTLGDGIGGLACGGAATTCVSGVCAFDPATTCTVQADCNLSPVVQKAAGTMADTLLAAVVKYIGAATACVQKCQDDFIDKKGNGFFDDTTACLIGNSMNAGLPGDANLNACLAKADGAFAKLTDANACGWTSLLKPTLLGPLLAGAVNSATNGAYDRVDIEASFLGGVLGSVPGMAAQAGSLAARGAPGQRVAYGSCGGCGDGVLSDYEECDASAVGGGNQMCGLIPGTLAGACPAADNSLAGVQACRCPR